MMIENIININLDKFKQVIDNINSNMNNIKGMMQPYAGVYPITNKDAFKKFKNYIGTEIPRSLYEYYENKAPYVIVWDYKDNDNNLLFGYTQIQSINSFTDGPMLENRIPAKKGERHKGILWDEGDDPKLIEKLEDSFFILDRIDPAATYYTIFKINEKTNEPELYLFRYPNILLPLIINFETYIALSIEVCGMFLWQTYFIDESQISKENKEIFNQERPDRFFDNMKAIFPNADLSLFNKPVYTEPHSFSIVASKKDYKRRFDKTFKDLKKLTKGGNLDYNPNYQSFSILQIRKAELALGRKLPDSMLAFYSQINGFNLSWKTKAKPENDLHYQYGECTMLSFDKIFAGFYNKNLNWSDSRTFEGIITFDSMGKEELEFASQCRVIYNEEYSTTVIRFVPEKEEPELYVFVVDENKFYPLSVNFTGFVESFLETRGIFNWQLHLIDTAALPIGEWNITTSFFNDMRILFPEIDLYKYRSF
jgi:hypothetical protein